MTITQTMENIFGLLERHCPKYMTPLDVGTKVGTSVEGRKSLSKSEIKQAKALRKQGCSYSDIATALGCSEPSAWRAVNKK